MPLTTPLALRALLFVPAVVAMYLLKLRREETIVPSTLLWQRLVADLEANAPWQRLRRSLLLLLQLLLVVILVLLAARPFVERPAGLARDIVLVIDTSASMAATDVSPNRQVAARDAALEALRDLPAGGKVSVIEAGRTARIVASATADLGRVRQAIDGIQPTTESGDLADALELASQLAAQAGDGEVLVVTDAALASIPTTAVDARLRVIRVGEERGRKNQAIVALAVRTASSSLARSVFISVANLDTEPAQRRIELWGDGNLLEARDVAIDAQQRADVIIDNVGDAGHPVGVVEVRLVAREAPADPATHPDQLAVDDRAWAIVPPDRRRAVLLVGAGDPYLETAVSYLPNSDLWGVTPDRYPQDAQRTDGTDWDLIIFEGTLPVTLPNVPVLAIAPPTSGPLGTVGGKLTNPGIGTLSPDEPILRYVDLSTTHIAEAVKLDLPAWARTVIPGPKGAPLLYTGVRAGLPSAVLAFEPRRSDLPLQVAFPILIANLAGELMGGSAAPVEAVKPGDPVSLPLPAGATGLRVERPDGSIVELAPGTSGGAAVTFTQTELLGVYSATAIRPAGSGSSPSAPASPATTPSPRASATPRLSASPGAIAAPVDPNAPIQFAVDLFDIGESAIAPKAETAAALEKLGRASPTPGASGVVAGGTAEARPAARDELWIPIVLLVLIGLCVEWALFHRDVISRGRRAIAARLRPAGRRPA
jgi:Ca-activated chloride channel family protein